MEESLPFAYRAIRNLIRLLLRIFFSEIACDGADHVPKEGGGLVVAWHPNGLIDPALIFSSFPRKIVFGARHGLLAWPLLGRWFRSIGTVPIYRETDLSGMSRSEKYNANQKSLDTLAGAVAEGSFSALFPEGLSHDHSHLSKVKTGAARLFYRASALTVSGEKLPVIIPIGLHYDRKNVFRSRVLVLIHPPVSLPAELDPARTPVEETSDAAGTAGTADRIASEKERCALLTRFIEKTLAESAHVTENWELHHLMDRARKLIRAERAFRGGRVLEPPGIREHELGFSRIWYAYRIRSIDAKERTERVMRRLAEYDSLLRATGIDDHQITSGPNFWSPRWFGMLVLNVFVIIVLLPPVLLPGLLINIVPYIALKKIDLKYSRAEKDRASIKLMVGSILFPVYWICIATLVILMRESLQPWSPVLSGSPFLVGALTLLFCIVTGILTLRYAEFSHELLAAVRVRSTRKRQQKTLDILKAERSSLFDELIEMSSDLDLPGSVTQSGSVVR